MWNKIFKRKGTTYHDVVVIIDSMEYKLSRSYGIKLECCRAAGWRLYNTWQKDPSNPSLIGGEYDSDSFMIKVNGFIVCDNTYNKD